MKQYIIKTLDFLKILDYDGGISLTNVAFIAILVKILITPNVEWAPIIALATSTINYMHKRSVNNDQ